MECATCKAPADAVNHVPGAIFVGWGHGWQTCPDCKGTRERPDPTTDAKAIERARAAASAAVVASFLAERLALGLGRHSHVLASPKMQAILAADRASAAKALRELALRDRAWTSPGDGSTRTATLDALTVERTTDADEVTRIARAWAAWAARVDP